MAALGAVSAVGKDAVPLLVQLLQYGVEPDLAAGLPGDGRTVVRLRAVHALGEVRDMRAGPVVCAHADDGNPVVRAEAATALGKIGGECALAVLVGLLQDTDQLVREMAARALGTLGHSDALPALRTGLQREQLPHVRKAMEEAIRLLEGRP